ncbi:MAG: ABC transporter ATP-binding protein [Rhodobacteraceae bacterium]|nr:ABC transporter ATP-binding protein [Paracoccaceae bacterium]
MTLLRIKNLSCRIGQVPILHDVGLSLEAGRIAGIIGESGCGKSMTAHAITRLLPPGSQANGTLLLDKTDILTASEAEMCALRGKTVSMIFQEPMTALNPVKTIGDQVAEAIMIHKDIPRSEAMAQTRATLDRVDIPADRFPLTRYPHEISGGQRQRVCIAMAIALRPKLLIADEPTTALDVTTQAGILNLLARLVREDGMGLLMISHDLAIMHGMADHIHIIQKGRVVENGPTRHLFRHMKHPCSRALLAAGTHRPDRKVKVCETPLLTVENVTRTYTLPRTGFRVKPGLFRAVDGVSFSIRKGESLGIVGESGCGKSTLARAILGLENTQAGEIRLGKEAVFTGKRPNRAVRRKMQVVFQDPYGSFNPRHKVARLVSEPFHLLDTHPADASDQVARALAAVGLTPEDADKYPHEFSGGQRQRIAIARALIIRPQLIILDEAVSALDISVRARILELLAHLSETHGLTYLFISHDLSVVRSITDRVLVMQLGKIVEEGPTEQIFDAPQHPYTRSLIAAAPQLPGNAT